jgi:hypothetical protein
MTTTDPLTYPRHLLLRFDTARSLCSLAFFSSSFGLYCHSAMLTTKERRELQRHLSESPTLAENDSIKIAGKKGEGQALFWSPDDERRLEEGGLPEE